MIKRNPVYPQSYNYQGDKAASYIGMFLKILLLIGITIVTVYLGFTFANVITYSEILIYMLLVPCIAGGALYIALKVEAIKSILSIVFALNQGLAVGYYVHAFYTLSGNPVVLIGVFTTIVILIVMLLINLIKPFREQDVLFKGFIAAFLGIAVSIVGSLGLDYLEITYSFDSLFVTIPVFSFFAALFYTVDFDQLFVLVDAEAPKNKEWDLALGLLITVVWIYFRVILIFIQILENARKRNTKR